MRALVSVSDKTGVAELARRLATLGYELVSTGGTARVLREAGLAVTDVSAVTGFPEMMDGRVKTLHPKVHGGLLALRDDPTHAAALREHGIVPIDVVVVNLYPFAATVERAGVTWAEAVENIDIGGPSMVRSAAKNHAWVMVLTSPEQYDEAASALEAAGGDVSRVELTLKRRLAMAAFAHTAAYDARIADFFARELGETSVRVRGAVAPLTFRQTLRYGENPHQPAALFVGPRPSEASVAFARQLHGKELSYINLLDADAALSAVKEFGGRPAACIVKHATPCGLAVGTTTAEAFRKAYAGDPLAAFGGIVAVSTAVDKAAAEEITSIDKLLEVIVAPSFSDDALELLRQRWKNCRLLEVGPLGTADPNELTGHRIVGGWLVQARDIAPEDESAWTVPTVRKPTEAELADLRFAMAACKHVKSNAVVIARDGMLLGVGAGQMDRMTASRLAAEKAGGRARGAVAASDAFFPFPDGPRLLLDAGVTAIIHPGGSVRDSETVALADHHRAAIVLTGRRHFRH
ncbi:MAG: bifunctional phosphoribosylaminoimidazolecarboxamide formyltransferase/IMP cyclohydrolase [Tepidisphaerales bacterium]